MQTVTLVLAILGTLGTIVAIVVGIIKITEFRRDRATIRVSATYGLMPVGLDPLADDVQDIIVLQAVNVGRRPITLTSAYLPLSDGRSILALRSLRTPLPCTLNESEECGLYISIESIREVEEEGVQVIAVAFRDSANKEYRRKFRVPPSLTE